MYGITSSPLQANYIRSQISHACATRRAAKEACLQTGLSPRMDTRCVGIVFYCESNRYAGLNAARKYSERILFPSSCRVVATERRSGAAPGARANGSATEQGRGAGRGPTHVDHPAGRGQGQQASPANQRGSRRSQPLPAGALPGSGFTLLTTRRLGPR